MSIEVKGLTKRFQAREKQPGLRGSFRALLRPEYRTVDAVDAIDFSVPQGEVLAFIGPNGAGKSTTIKMLTGILTPTAGSMRVLDLDPTTERRKLAKRIGTVFGQKSQLSFHLPAYDSFELLGAIYDVPRDRLKKRIDELAERFEMGEFLRMPVRKLSLGQRIRCEVAASLLHDPDIIFLDEPTIGLDVVAKQAIRELLTELNRERGTTMFLTSHDAGDIEQVCERTIIIHHGRIVLDLPVKKLKYNYMNRKIVSVRFFEPQSVPELPGIAIEKSTEYTAKISVDTKQTPIGQLMQQLTGTGFVEDITVSDPPLEEIIADIYRA